MSQPPSARRLAIWAAFLVVPLVLAALAIPWLTRRLGASTGAGAGDPATGAAAVAPRPGGDARTQLEAVRAADEAVARAQAGWQHVETMAPREARRDATGELVAPFQGFGLSLESTPAGASVRVAGRDVGETPLVTTVDCQPGDEIEVRVERRPYRPAIRKVRCRADALLTVQVSLTR